MENIRELAVKELELLRGLLSADVAAVAWQRAEDRRLVWWAATGCSDERYRTLSIRQGRGIEGTAVRIGRPLVLDEAAPGAPIKREESALMLVERLQAAIACPIAGSGGLSGLLLAGHRESHRYTQEDRVAAQLSARWLGQLRDYAENGEPIPQKQSHLL